MVPVLILQIFLFPLTAGWLMDVWVNSRRSLALQETADHLGSSIQQLYFTLNHETIPVGTITQKANVPAFIETYPYTGNCSLKTVLSPPATSSKMLKLMLKMSTVGTTVSTSVILGPNVQWSGSIFRSNSTNAGIRAEKLLNGTIRLSFIS
jgi:hypothetical protein